MELVNGIRNETRVLPHVYHSRLWIHSAEHIEEIGSDLRRQLDSNYCSNAYPALISFVLPSQETVAVRSAWLRGGVTAVFAAYNKARSSCHWHGSIRSLLTIKETSWLSSHPALTRSNRPSTQPWIISRPPCENSTERYSTQNLTSISSLTG
jgi:hypothetical protein